MAGEIAGASPNYMTQDQFSSQLDSWWKKQQPLAQSQPLGAQGQAASVYQPSYGPAPMQQMFSPLNSWSAMGMGYGGGFGGGFGGYGGYGMQTPFGFGQQMGYGGYQQPMYGGFGRGFGYGRPAPTNVTTPDSPGTTA